MLTGIDLYFLFIEVSSLDFVEIVVIIFVEQWMPNSNTFTIFGLKSFEIIDIELG